MTEAIKASISKKDKDGKLLTASEYLEIVDKQHPHHTKTYASTTIGSLVAMKYTGGKDENGRTRSKNISTVFYFYI
jgi:hypothetical protein